MDFIRAALRKACVSYVNESLRQHCADDRPFNGNDIRRWAEYAEDALCEEVLNILREMEASRAADLQAQA